MQFLKDSSIKYAFSFTYKDLSKKDNLLNIPRFGLSHGSPSHIKKKLIFGEYWENIKNLIYEAKHRKLIKSKVRFF